MILDVRVRVRVRTGADTVVRGHGCPCPPISDDDDDDDDDESVPERGTLDGGVDRLTLTRLIYDRTNGQWNGESFTAPTEGLYEFTIRMVGFAPSTLQGQGIKLHTPPSILPKINGLEIDEWRCNLYGEADCQKTFLGKIISL